MQKGLAESFIARSHECVNEHVFPSYRHGREDRRRLVWCLVKSFKNVTDRFNDGVIEDGLQRKKAALVTEPVTGLRRTHLKASMQTVAPKRGCRAGVRRALATPRTPPRPPLWRPHRPIEEFLGELPVQRDLPRGTGRIVQEPVWDVCPHAVELDR